MSDSEPTDDTRVVDCNRCPRLAECRSQIVNGVGPEDADVLFVGEGPGENEDEQGEPFVGRSGDVLDDALTRHGFSREGVRITNCVRCRPPGNRDPADEELSNCRDHLEQEIAAVNPDLIVALGKVPAQHLLGRSVSVTAEAGEIDDARLAGEKRRLLVCVHPAATLYDPTQRDAFDDAISLAAEITGREGGQSTLGQF